MPLNITMADYGVGNLHSIRKALELCGATVNIVDDMSLLKDAECIVLPGVGAFDKSVERLLPFRDEIVARLSDGVPCLGICIGMQMMFQGSEEGNGPGLGYLQGKVVRMKAPRIPHMGWNLVRSSDRIMDRMSDPYFYFAHSYHGAPEDYSDVGHTEYYGEIPTLFHKGNTYGTQFHPEKSSNIGLEFLGNFVKFAEENK
ncbi:MAG: imidazole glycerol phosphate synthase subunit HisH [Methanomassiliicoccales archaeon]|nr:imidazole glycerol phosphate synthase subunit HisH [Methanomassiliicoccales archaeon]